MPNLTRRTFLRSSLAAGVTFTIGGTKSTGRVLGANDTIRVAIAGLNGRGGAHVGEFAERFKDGVEIIYLIDPDKRTFAGRVRQVEAKGGRTPKTVQDVRTALDDKNLDAISIATPNHWHALMTIWACQAGKDVYVEKPCSHNVHEGRIAVEVARKHQRIVQHGTQGRSSERWATLAEIVKSGKLGKLLVSRGLCYKSRGSIGVKEPNAAPAEVDFNLWLGPAAQQPHHGNLVHYNWHWFWDFGNGDIGNQGVHQMDVARWMIPGATLPKSVISLGGRFGYTDQGETPNTQIAVMDFGETQLIFEVRGLRTDKLHGEGVGNMLHFESGVVAGNKFYPKGKETPEPLPGVDVEVKRGVGGGIFGNFLAAVRSRRREDLDADILEGHYSSALGHLANISYRLGGVATLDSVKSLDVDPRTRETCERLEAHLAGNGLNRNEIACRVGRRLQVDPKSETITNLPSANKYLMREYRKPFVVPEKVA